MEAAEGQPQLAVLNGLSCGGAELEQRRINNRP
jgi:hypothetical protein